MGDNMAITSNAVNELLSRADAYGDVLPGGELIRDLARTVRHQAAVIHNERELISDLDNALARLTFQNSSLKEENDRLHKKAYLTIPLPRFLRRHKHGDKRDQ